MNYTLRETFKLSSLRGNQAPVINATMQGKDALVLMPTGGGKSLCYQLPAVLSDGVTIIISPLVSLIQDQLFHLHAFQIPAACLSPAFPEDEKRVYDDFYSGSPAIKCVYATPEKVARSDKLLRALDRLNQRGLLARVVIDEAHCISSWCGLRCGRFRLCDIARVKRCAPTHQASPPPAPRLPQGPRLSHGL